MHKLLKGGEIVLSRLQHKISSLDVGYLVKKVIEATLDNGKRGDAFERTLGVSPWPTSLLQHNQHRTIFFMMS